ncbi:MAG: hypothetical protein WC099_01120 [Candidatus Paceibacterota bacterium]
MTESIETPALSKHKKRVLYIWLGLVGVIILGVLLMLKPFSREQDKVQQLRTMGADEQKTDQAASDVSQYIQDERALKDIDQSLKDFQAIP